MHNSLRDGKAKSRAAGVQARGYESVKDIRQNFGRNAWSIILYCDGDPGPSVTKGPPGLHEDFPRRRNCMKRVSKQIHKDLNQAIAVAGDEYRRIQGVQELSA